MGPNPGKGHFHLTHRIDGKLVAISVIVILEENFSSLYFIHDMDFAFLNLGVVSVVKEIELMRNLNSKYGMKLKYYAIEDVTVNCPKLTYKFNYGPAEILDPYTFTWLKLTP